MTTPTLGLDIGGANLKAAHSDGSARTVPFALWKHPERLADELRQLSATMPAYQRVGVTMTGELCDCFATKSDGVRAILQAVNDAYVNIPVRLWSLDSRFIVCQQAF